MTTSITTRPFVVHEVAQRQSSEARSLDAFELRTVGLSAAANLLRMPIADLDCVSVAAAKADIQCCPLCRARRHRAA